MSWRTWLGDGKKDWADYNLSDYDGLESLTADVAWRLPAKVVSPDPDTLLEFFNVLDHEWNMSPSEFWIVIVEGHQFIEHPTALELFEYIRQVRLGGLKEEVHA